MSPRFDLKSGTVAFGDIPWPDDLYMSSRGSVAVADLPFASDESHREALREALSDLDGFGVSSPVYFYFDGAIDPSSLPADEQASLEESASVFLVDADPGSANAFTRVPARVHWHAGSRRLTLRPALGHVLVPGRRYAAVVTRRVRDENGEPIAPADAFAAVRDDADLRGDAALLAARAAYAPVLETFERLGFSRSRIAALAVFRVQNVRRGLEDARTVVRAMAAKPSFSEVVTAALLDERLGTPEDDGAGIDRGGGVAHAAVGALVHGTLPSPNFLSVTAKTHGAFELDEAGTLRVKRTESVPFTLFLPRTGMTKPLPVVIFQHGLRRERSDALAVANLFARIGVAVVSIDAPFHGLRAKGTDTTNRFTGASTPDGFGDSVDDFEGFDDESGALLPQHPFYLRDAMRQGVVDLMGVVRMIEAGELSALLAADAQLARYQTLLTKRLGFIGMDLGGQLGAMLATVEPSVDAAVFAFSGGGLLEEWAWSPAKEALFDRWKQRWGRTGAHEDEPMWTWPELAVAQALLDRADPLAHAPSLRRTSTQVLMLMADEDEVVPNRTTETLAFAIGASLVNDSPRHVPALPVLDVLEGRAFDGNFVIGQDTVTRALLSYDATHDALLSERGMRSFAAPVEPPFSMLAEPDEIENPTSVTVAQLALYFASFFGCADADVPVGAGDDCDAAVVLP